MMVTWEEFTIADWHRRSLMDSRLLANEHRWRLNTNLVRLIKDKTRWACPLHVPYISINRFCNNIEKYLPSLSSVIFSILIKIIFSRSQSRLLFYNLGWWKDLILKYLVSPYIKIEFRKKINISNTSKNIWKKRKIIYERAIFPDIYLLTREFLSYPRLG